MTKKGVEEWVYIVRKESDPRTFLWWAINRHAICVFLFLFLLNLILGRSEGGNCF